MKITYNLNDPTSPVPLPPGPWCEADIWIDPDGDWWVRTPMDRMFFVQGPETPLNRPLWGRVTVRARSVWSWLIPRPY